MPFVNRFTTTDRGAITITGNALGLSKQTGVFAPGTNDSIGGFITTNTSLPVPSGWESIVNLANGENITLDWTQNSSSAFLNMPLGSTVLYAELIWGGLSVSTGILTGTLDVTPFIDNPIRFTTPLLTTNVSPDPTTSFVASIGNNTYYSKSANVTTIVATSGTGRYTAGSVPSALNRGNNTTNTAGWTLIVVYLNNLLPSRNMSIFAGGYFIESGSTVDITLSGFLTPPIGIVNTRISVSGLEGDATRSQDQMLFGPNILGLVNLSGPNNPQTNFFASQINNGDPNSPNVGTINTTGTFGNRNQNAITQTNISGGRQGWDITNVNGSGILGNSQNTALVRFITSGDIYLVNSLSIQIDSVDINTTKQVNTSIANIGDFLTYTVQIINNSTINLNNIFFQDTTPNATTYNPSSLVVSTIYTGLNPDTGITIPTMLVNEVVTISWQVQVTTIPNPNTILNTGTVRVQGLPEESTNTVATYINLSDVSVVKSVTPSTVIAGQTITYNIDISNLGPSTAQGVVLVDTVPNQIINPQYLPIGGVTWIPWINSINIGTMIAGTTQTVQIRGKVREDATGNIINTAIIRSITPDPNINNNTSTNIIQIQTFADISVIKSI